jgi:hypothetical protein
MVLLLSSASVASKVAVTLKLFHPKICNISFEDNFYPLHRQDRLTRTFRIDSPYCY